MKFSPRVLMSLVAFSAFGGAIALADTVAPTGKAASPAASGAIVPARPAGAIAPPAPSGAAASSSSQTASSSMTMTADARRTGAASKLQKRQLDIKNSVAAFSIAHVDANEITGTIPVTGGMVELRSGTIIPDSVTATLDPESIKTGNTDRDEAVRMNMQAMDTGGNTWAFVSTKITPTGANSFVIDGMLVAAGQKAPVQLDAHVISTSPRLVYRAIGHIDQQHLFASTAESSMGSSSSASSTSGGSTASSSTKGSKAVSSTSGVSATSIAASGAAANADVQIELTAAVAGK